MDDDELTPPRGSTPTSLPRYNPTGVIRPPDRADRELADQLRQHGSDPFVAVAALARALAKFEEDSGSRSNEQTEMVLELPDKISALDKRITAVEFPVGIGKWIAMTLAGGLVGGIIWASHEISANGEQRGVAAEQARTLKVDVDQLKSSKADVGLVEAVRYAVEELKRDVRYLERHEGKK